MDRKIGIGIIGCGLMGTIHAECAARARGARLVGYQNRHREKAEGLAKRFGGRVYGSVAEMLRDPAVDAVVIASSQQAHAEQALAACRARKHVLCEKPLALTPAEMGAVARAAVRAKRTFMVGHQLRFHPVVDAVKRAMPRLGRAFHLDLEWTFRIKGAGGRCWEDYRSGGFFMELGCHLADLARHLLGDVRHVVAGTLRLDPRRVTEDCTHALLGFRGGAIGSIVVSANHRTIRQGLLRGRLLGEKGRLDFTVYPYARAFNAATLTLDRGRSVFVPDETVFRLAPRRPRSLFRVYPGFYDVYQRQMAAFLAAARRGTRPPITLEDGRAAVGIILAAYASQGAASDRPNFLKGGPAYRADAACHPALGARVRARKPNDQ